MAKTEYPQSRAVAANIEYIARTHRLDRKKLAAVMSISESVLYSRLNNPETFRMEELERLAAWSTKRGFPVLLAQMCKPFVPAKVDPMEVSA